MSADPQPVAELNWFKSSYSGGNATECVEAVFIPSGVLIRDSKRPAHANLAVSAAAWAGFLAGTPHLTPASTAPTA
ncbi:DUF397 domain-containing protein [Streptomyces ipomoeae]|uniref:DUF397 domain-containing protein n=1 Tax=Streptomyces ipomoeae TaxID=103232 RepID=A0AAE9AYV4_9ACTN|nr:DUF397 domain-containing protein [Streptomyces ipomoeae]TQE27159.1 DUF397 domain-containing protein [Streptomyces ipomoeae]TQE31982.1 DUF397 domain-containing protein [Streptomyces ipomoeae]